MTTRNRIHTTTLAAAVLCLVASGPVAAAEVAYYLTGVQGAPEGKNAYLPTLEDDTIWVTAEAVAVIKSENVREAVITREPVEILDEEEPVSELFFVTLVLDETENAELTRTMDGLCKTKMGVHIAVDGTVIDYRPLVLCGHFSPTVSFTEKKAAEEFAKKLSPKAVRFATPPTE